MRIVLSELVDADAFIGGAASMGSGGWRRGRGELRRRELARFGDGGIEVAARDGMSIGHAEGVSQGVVSQRCTWRRCR